MFPFKSLCIYFAQRRDSRQINLYYVMACLADCEFRTKLRLDKDYLASLIRSKQLIVVADCFERNTKIDLFNRYILDYQERVARKERIIDYGCSTCDATIRYTVCTSAEARRDRT